MHSQATPVTSVTEEKRTGKKRLEISFGGHSSRGTKAENQDAFAVRQPDSSTRNYKGCVACIADGVSCSDNAQQASQTSVATFIDDYFSTPDTWPVRTSAARVLSSLNSWLYHHGQQNFARHNTLVTTFTALIIKSHTAHIFHAGDSRLYRLRQNDLELLTRDHNHHQGGRSVLTRALGMDSHLEVDYIQEETETGDVFLLSTDGIHEFLSDADLKHHLQQVQENTCDTEHAASSLTAAALANGSNDNLSSLIIRVESLPEEDINEAHRRLTRLRIPPVMEPGMSIDGYQITEVLYSGTRSHLYRVSHPDREQEFVLKAPSENFAEDPVYLEGFIREQWVGRRIDHPNVMKIFPRDSSSPFLYHLCEYIEGQSLRQWMYDHPQPETDTVRRKVTQVISGLRAFQRLSMVHRDLKPENILIDHQGTLKIIDFGTVQVSGLDEIQSPVQETCPVGSADYIAPEYLMGEKGIHRSDIFSLGVIAYEMLTGSLPFRTSRLPNHIPKHTGHWQYISARSVRKNIPDWTDLALKKATEPNPARRYDAMSEFLQDFTVPNHSMLEKLDSAPLLERNPVRFWKIISACLFLIAVTEGFILLSGN